jgi:hypothetical protein
VAVIISGTNGISGVSTVNLANGSVTQNILANNVAGTGPAFRAYLGSNQTSSSGVATKVQMNTEDYDTANCFDTSLYRFTPNVSGYYQVNVLVHIGGTGLNNSCSYLYKNGSSYQLGQFLPSASSPNVSVLSALVYMNGTTDYLEAYATGAVTSGSVTFTAGSLISNFAAVLVRAA